MGSEIIVITPQVNSPSGQSVEQTVGPLGLSKSSKCCCFLWSLPNFCYVMVFAVITALM